MRSKLICTIAAGLLLFPINAYASINGNEAELLAIINSTREYNGVWYQVAPQYREAARNYLDDPSIDCTDEQKQKAINQMFGSIQQGIDEGYLIPVSGGQTASGDSSGSSNHVSQTQDSETAGGEYAEGTVQSAEQPDGGAVLAAQPEAAAEMQGAALQAQGEQTAEETAMADSEVSKETETAETEPSPIVLALEAAMNAPSETSEAMKEGSLLPVEGNALTNAKSSKAASVACLAAAGVFGALSYAAGLFKHRHKKRRKHHERM